MTGGGWGPIGLWSAVVASGVYHGINPGMGWPLAVSNGLMERRPRALFAALGYLALGHGLAMALVLLPFAALMALIAWQREIEIGASGLLIAFGAVLVIRRRHPRALARIPPSRLALWSFVVALAHGAGLMLAPIYLGLCRASDLDAGHRAAAALIGAHLGMAVLVSLAHGAALILSGGALAWLTYRYLGLRFVARSWFNLDLAWAVSLLLVGAATLAIEVRA